MKHTKIASILGPKVITMKRGNTLADAMQIMASESVSSVVMIDESVKPIGIFTEHDILEAIASHRAQETLLEKIMSDGVLSVEMDEDIHDAYALMSARGYRHIVVVDEKGVLVGLASQGDFLRHIGLEQFVKFKVTKEVMNKSLLSIEKSSTLEAAAQKMNERGVDYAIVVENDLPQGLINERDITLCIAKGGDAECSVTTCWHTDYPTVNEATPLHEAASMMEQHGVHQLLVINDQEILVGLLGRDEVLNAIHGGYFEFLIKLVDEKSSAISKMKAAKERLVRDKELIEQNEIKLRTLFDLLPYAVLIVDMESGLQHEFNTIAYEQIGYSAEEFAQMRISDFEAIESLEEHQQHLEKIRTQGHDRFETKFRCKDGSLIDIDVNVVHIMLSDRPYLMAVCQNITNIKEAEAQKKERQKAFETQAVFLRTLVDTIPDLVWLKDLEGRYLACNPMFERLYGKSEAQILGKDDFVFVDRELAEFFRENDREAIKFPDGRMNEEYLTFADGTYEGLFETTKKPMKNEADDVIGILGIAHDISEIKRREEELNRAQSLAHIGSWVLDISSGVLRWSDECYRIFGIEIGAPMSYELFLEAIHPDDRKIVDNAWQAALAGEPYDIEHRIVVDGKIRWVKEHAQLKIDSQGNLISGVGTVQEISERKEREKQLEYMANYDALTGLANRNLLQSHLQYALEQARRQGEIIALVMFDLDRFKDVNDSYGHASGDELLDQVAKRFESRLREGDLIARLGGDEFAVVLENLSRPEDAARTAEEIITLLSEPYRLEGAIEVRVGASAGIALFPNHGVNAVELLQHADAALYLAKAQGRGVYRYYTDELTELARRRIECEFKLRQGIENQNLEVYYQPQVHMATGRIVGAEALVRWNDPERGMVSPAEFIPMAEETGLINLLGEWVLKESCRQGKVWHDKGHRLTIAVNVSAHQIRNRNFSKIVEKVLQETGFSAHRLELELTESALMEDPEGITVMLHTLRAQGIRLAIDDFGTGYSSLSYLKRFPLDVLKIDKSFVDGLPYDSEDVAIVTAIIAMGKALGYQVLAEGTEQSEQIDFLRDKGCDQYQGYFKSRPVPSEEFEKLLN